MNVTLNRLRGGDMVKKSGKLYKSIMGGGSAEKCKAFVESAHIREKELKAEPRPGQKF